jgi:NAD(P)-dependent dehydrogenase (short-subunit alcohol dehydrogenase family)
MDMSHHQVVLITGANTGIGKVVALELAKKDMTVVLACRNEEQTQRVIEEIQRESGNQKIYFLKLDLTSLASVQSCANEFRSRFTHLHILINNAGILSTDDGNFQVTKDQHEMIFQVNYLGHFLLTLLLLDIIERSEPARIINVSSKAHIYGVYHRGTDPTKLKDATESDFYTLYGYSKLCNILFSNYLAKKLAHKRIFVNSLHPGIIKTNITRNLDKSKSRLLSLLFRFVSNVFSSTPEKGAQTTLFIALSPTIEEQPLTGHYFIPPGKISSPSSYAKDEELQKQLWDFSVKACEGYLLGSTYI